MTSPAALFAALVREAPAPDDDAPDPRSFTGWCQTCADDTRWRHITNVNGQQIYMCDGCSNTRVYGKE